jgi:hypothetical protein
MAKIILFGHGGWTPNDGFTILPANSSITFYTQNAKLLKGGDDFKILWGTFTGGGEKIGPYRSCTNLRLYPDSPSNLGRATCTKPAGVDLYFANNPAGERLSDIFGKLPGNDFHWACCRYLDLRKVSGPNYGVNLVEEVDKYSRWDDAVRRYFTVLKK